MQQSETRGSQWASTRSIHEPAHRGPVTKFDYFVKYFAFTSSMYLSVSLAWSSS